MTLAEALQRSSVKTIAPGTLTTTQNGAVTQATTGNEVLNFFSQMGALRNQSENVAVDLFKKAYFQDKLLALKALFHSRDIRGGLGERKVFRTILAWLATNDVNSVKANLENIPFYGRWDDILSLFGTNAETLALELIKNQLKKDVGGCNVDSISLLAKWLPSINTSSRESVSQAYKIANYLGWNAKKYRKTLSKLRNYLNIVERNMCANDWESIDYSVVSSSASLLYKDAFKKHDSSRYVKWQQDVKTCKNGAKVNASTLYPYDIVRDILSSYGNVETANLQWAALPNYLKDSPDEGLVLCDTSSSMEGAFNGNVKPIHVSVSLALYIAERMKGPFKNQFITFSEKPQLMTISGNTITDKVRNIAKAPWGGNTNLMAVFKLILDSAVKYKVSAAQMPKILYIVSDMEFDQACHDNSLTNFQQAKLLYKQAGYEVPKIVFWRVNVIKEQQPVTLAEKNTVLVSGCSPSVLKTVLTNRVVTPFSIMLETLNAERYNRVTLNTSVKQNDEVLKNLENVFSGFVQKPKQKIRKVTTVSKSDLPANLKVRDVKSGRYTKLEKGKIVKIA